MEQPQAGHLVILRRPVRDGALADLRGRCQVVSVVEPRLAIVLATPAQIAAIEGLSGIEAVQHDDDVSETFVASLNPAERLFVDAWLLRRGQKKERPGDGLSWDALPFSPPDEPPDR